MVHIDTEILLKQVALGNREARELLLDRHRERLKRMISARIDERVRKRVDPSDVVQEALVIANERLEQYLTGSPLPFYPWLRQIAWDQLIACHRVHLYARRRSQQREEDIKSALSNESVGQLASSVVDESANPLGRLVQNELRQRVRAAIEQLPEKLREVLVLRHLEQLTNAEAAEVLSIGVSAAKMRHARAIEQLIALLHDRPDESEL